MYQVNQRCRFLSWTETMNRCYWCILGLHAHAIYSDVISFCTERVLFGNTVDHFRRSWIYYLLILNTNLVLRIRWQFNLAKAPWWGGFFERLVKQVKSCLKKSLGRSKLSFDELTTHSLLLTTILVEVEAVLNSWPLSYLYSDDVEEPLTSS